MTPNFHFSPTVMISQYNIMQSPFYGTNHQMYQCCTSWPVLCGLPILAPILLLKSQWAPSLSPLFTSDHDSGIQDWRMGYSTFSPIYQSPYPGSPASLPLASPQYQSRCPFVLCFISSTCFGCKTKYLKSLQPPADLCMRLIPPRTYCRTGIAPAVNGSPSPLTIRWNLTADK